MLQLSVLQSIDEIVESLAIQATYSEDAATAAAGSVESTPVGLVAVPKKIVKLEELMDFLQRPSVSKCQVAMTAVWHAATFEATCVHRFSDRQLPCTQTAAFLLGAWRAMPVVSWWQGSLQLQETGLGVCCSGSCCLHAPGAACCTQQADPDVHTRRVG